MTILIAGGGIAGLALWLTLRFRCWPRSMPVEAVRKPETAREGAWATGLSGDSRAEFNASTSAISELPA